MTQLFRRIGFVVLCSVSSIVPNVTQAGTAEALKELEKAPFFPFGGVGIVGSRAPSDTLFLQLASDANNATLFRSLWSGGNNEAKCYALLGLYWLKDPVADEFAQRLVSGHVSVATAHGCIVGTREQVATFVAILKSGEYIQDYFPELAAQYHKR